MTARPDLPARDISSMQLADLLSQPGCPLCRERDRTTARYIESILAESVNDVGFRRQLDERRGFCRAHVHEVAAADRARTGGSLASAILFAAMLSIRAAELTAARAAGSRGRGQRLAKARQTPRCPICEHAEAAEVAAAEALVGLARDAAWADAIAESPLCLDHLTLLMAQPRKPARWDAVEHRQAERMAALGDRLRSFAHHSSQDRRSLITEEERSAAAEAAALLGGTDRPRS